MVCRVLSLTSHRPSWLFTDAKKPSAELGISRLVNEKQAAARETYSAHLGLTSLFAFRASVGTNCLLHSSRDT